MRLATRVRAVRTAACIGVLVLAACRCLGAPARHAARARLDNSAYFTQPVRDSPRARRYMALFDAALARAIAGFDASRGLVRHTVPPETAAVPAWVARLDRQARKKYVTATNRWADRVGRTSASTISAVGLAYVHPRSRYYRDAALLLAVRAGLRAFERVQAPSGEFVFTPLREATIDGSHVMAWWLEDLLTAWFCVHRQLPPGERRQAWVMLERAMRFLRATPCDSATNRGMVWTGVMSMCWRATGERAYLNAAQKMWDRIRAHVLQPSGEILEGCGPDSNYSPISMEYLLRYRQMTGDRSLDAVVVRSLDWMAEMYTDTGVPLLGVSTRYDLQNGGRKMVTMLPGLERYASLRSWYARLSQTILAVVAVRYPGELLRNGAISWLTAASLHDSASPDRPPAARSVRPPWLHRYEGQATAYWTVGTEAYRALLVLRGRPPRKGLQTWAVAGSRPLISPEPDRESTVLAWGMDLASRDVSLQDESLSDESAVPSVSARHGRLWVTYLIGPRSLIVVHTLPGGERETLWRGSTDYVMGYRLSSDGGSVEADGASGSLRWWGPAPVIDDGGLTIRFKDEAPTQIYAFSSDALRRGADLPAADRPRLVRGSVVLVEWEDRSGRFVAVINHGDREQRAEVAMAGGATESVSLRRGHAHVWRLSRIGSGAPG